MLSSLVIDTFPDRVFFLDLVSVYVWCMPVCLWVYMSMHTCVEAKR